MPKKSVRKSRGPQKKGSRKKNKSSASPAGKEQGSGEESPQPPDVGPFDAQFFEHQFPNLLPPGDKKARPARSQPYVVTVVLGDGMVQFEIVRIEELSDQWALLEVHESPGRRDGSGPNRFVFVPYGAIARVEVSGTESGTAAIGFHRKPVEKKMAVGKPGGRKKPVARKPVRKPARKPARKKPARRKRASGTN